MTGQGSQTQCPKRQEVEAGPEASTTVPTPCSLYLLIHVHANKMHIAQ